MGQTYEMYVRLKDAQTNKRPPTQTNNQIGSNLSSTLVTPNTNTDPTIPVTTELDISMTDSSASSTVVSKTNGSAAVTQTTASSMQNPCKSMKNQ